MIKHNKAPQQKGRSGAYFKCEKCGEEFYCTPSRIKQSLSKGVTIRYCSMKCYDKNGSKNPFHGRVHVASSVEKMVSHPNRPSFGIGVDNPNFTRFGEEFGYLGSHAEWWKRKLKKEIGQCERCGFSVVHILHVHHKDRDRSHNERVNLELLCPNCHALEHLEHGDGSFTPVKKRRQAGVARLSS